MSPRKSFFRLTDRREFPLFREHREIAAFMTPDAMRSASAQAETMAAYLQLELRPGNPRRRILGSNLLKDFQDPSFSEID
jgi:hypothetical protein